MNHTNYKKESIKKEYNKFYKKSDFIKFVYSDKKFISSLIRFLGITNNINILDICCGTGKYSRYFFNLDHSVTGIDISDVAITNAKELEPKIKWICDDVITYRYPEEKFDLVFLSGPSFYNDENIDSNLPFLDKMKKSIKTDGYIIFVKTTSLTDDWSKRQSRIDYKLETLISHFDKVSGLKKISSRTLYPQMFILFGKYAFSSKLLSFFQLLFQKSRVLVSVCIWYTKNTKPNFIIC